MNRKRTIRSLISAIAIAVGIGIVAAPAALADTYVYSPSNGAYVAHFSNAQGDYVLSQVQHQYGVYGGVTQHRISKLWFGDWVPGCVGCGGKAIVHWTWREQERFSDGSYYSIGGGDASFPTPNSGGSWIPDYNQAPLHPGATYVAEVFTDILGRQVSVRWQL